MRSLLKYLLPLAVVVPLVAFVAGSLASAAGDEPPARQPIVLHQDDSSLPADRKIEPSPTPTDRRGDDDARDDDNDANDDSDNSDDANDGDNGDVPVVTPLPVDDDEGDDGEDNDDDGGDDGDD